MQTSIQFTRINNDTNGNPRYVCHFMNFLNANERVYTYEGESFDLTKPILNIDVSSKYTIDRRKAKKIGGRKFHNKQYGGGIVFQSYNIADTEKSVIEAAKN